RRTDQRCGSASERWGERGRPVRFSDGTTGVSMTCEWKGKWALITGASAGIGKALAEELAAGGANLVLTARRVDRLQQIASNLRSRHKIQVEIFEADLAKPLAPEAVFRFIEEKGIAIDLLVNNAGFGQYGELSAVETQ